MIDESRLERLRRKGHKKIARCPACAELGHDKKGNHLIIDESGRFACVVYPGAYGKDHRKRVFALVGLKEKASKNKIIKRTFKIRSQPSHFEKKIIISDVLGQLGHKVLTPSENSINQNSHKFEIHAQNTIPNVPNGETV